MYVDMVENLIHCIPRNFMIFVLRHTLFRDQIKEMKWEGHLARLRKTETHARFWCGNLKGNVARMGEKRVLVGKPEGKRPFGRPRRRQEDNTMDLQEAGCGGID